MGELVLRVEGVSLSATVYDTQDLGATQGASLALLDAPRQVAKAFPALAPLKMGASQGVFALAAGTGEAAAQGLAQQVRDFLRDHPVFGQLCFVVHAGADEKLAWASNRIGQMQNLSVVLPDPGTMGCCTVDRVRPAALPDGDKDTVSVSVRRRRDYRRDRRQSFYRDEIGIDAPEESAHSFHDIVANPPDETPEALHNKIAVLYFDGNKFGEKIGSGEGQVSGDEIQRLRRHLLEAMVPAMGGFRQSETILWGGDEMMWVAPSWRLWPSLTTYFAKVESIRQSHGLTHAGGVVVCHHKTPIRLATKLAKELADKAKGGRDSNAIQLEILESIDIPDGYLNRQRRRLFGDDIRDGDFTVNAETWPGLCASMQAVTTGFPRSQLYRLLKMAPLTSRQPDDAKTVLAELDEVLKDRDCKCARADLVGADDDVRRMARVATLWDYFVPENPS